MQVRIRHETGKLTPALLQQAAEIEAIARAHGLDFFETQFRLLDASNVNGVAAYGGFPVRYPSWRFGMEFERLEKGYQYGLSKIYELVINNDPVYAYLVRSNSALEQKLVMAHVFGHADFFKHNCWFQTTDRSMINTMGSHSTRVRRYVDRYGLEPVERFIDRALSIDTLIDPYLPLRSLLKPVEQRQPDGSVDPSPPTYDIIGFLAQHARIEDWQRDILGMVRAEAYYFQPQRMTKIMNEGWASFWHSRLLTGGILDASEIVDFADCHSGATQQAPGQLNPYKLGIELFRHAEREGRDIFQLRRRHNDASFIDELVDEAFCVEQKLFVYGRNPRSGQLEVLDRDWRKVKQGILRDLAWGGLPQIEIAGVVDGKLMLQHHHDGRDLQLRMAGATLIEVERLWGAPVELVTCEEGEPCRLLCEDGEVRSVETDEEPETAGAFGAPEGPDVSGDDGSTVGVAQP